MWWVIGIIFCIGLAVLTGAVIRAGGSWQEEDEDYMTGDDYTDWGDKS